MKIAGYLRTSLIEWSGKITSVIFVPGCNFRCPFCHNRDLVDPQRIKDLPEFKEEEVLADLAKRKKWIDGVVITGGEPTLQPDLAKFLSKVKKMGFLTMVETNGSNPEVIRNLIIRKLVNYITMDLKGPLDKYEKFIQTEKDNFKFKIKNSVELIVEDGVEWEFRTTVVPGLHNEEVLVEMAEETNAIIRNWKLGIKNCRWFLQTFQPKNCLDPRYKKINPYSKIKMKGFLNAVKEIIPGAKIRD